MVVTMMTKWKQMETVSVLLSLCEGNPPVTFGFPSQRPVTQCFDVSFEIPVNWDAVASGISNYQHSSGKKTLVNDGFMNNSSINTAHKI